LKSGRKDYNTENTNQMNTIERMKIGKSKLYRIKTGHSESVQVCVPPHYGSKPTPRIFTGSHAPMLELSRRNFVEVLRAHRSGKAVA
jgi:hypothetical protein